MRNEITGDIMTVGVDSDESAQKNFEYGWDRIFGTKTSSINKPSFLGNKYNPLTQEEWDARVSASGEEKGALCGPYIPSSKEETQEKIDRVVEASKKMDWKDYFSSTATRFIDPNLIQTFDSLPDNEEITLVMISTKSGKAYVANAEKALHTLGEYYWRPDVAEEREKKWEQASRLDLE